MDQDGMCGDSEKCSDCRHFGGGTIRFIDRLDMGCERKKK